MEELEKDPDAFGRKVDASCLTGVENGVTKTYSASSLKEATPAQKLQYLALVDKGIYTQRLKQKLSMSIGVAMFIAGALTIVVTVMSGGIAPVIIALASAIFFILMEGFFWTYDSSSAFEWFRDKLYTESQFIADLRAAPPLKPTV